MSNTIQINKVHRQTYNQLAAQYEKRASSRSKGNLDRVKYVSSFTSGTDVLDVGCAVGIDIEHFNSLGYRTSGIELAPRMVEHARERNPSSKIIEGDFFNADLDKQDTIFARAFIHLFPKRVAVDAMRKSKDLLRGGGIAFFGVTGSTTPSEGWESKSDYNGSPVRFKKKWSLKELHNCLVDVCGFEHLSTLKTVDSEGKNRIGLVVRKPKFIIC